MGVGALGNAAGALVVEAAGWAGQNGRRPGDFKVPLAAGRSPDGEPLNGVPAYGFWDTMRKLHVTRNGNGGK